MIEEDTVNNILEIVYNRLGKPKWMKSNKLKLIDPKDAKLFEEELQKVLKEKLGGCK